MSLIPRATYRLQFHRGFTLRDATDLIPYLAQLGISHLYASPLLKARAGSMHGYDIVSYDQLNPEIGTIEDFDAMCTQLRARDMGLLLDIVPNHMAVGTDNEWWQDVLENGVSSKRARYFDIDWNPAKRELAGKVLLAVLGDHYGSILDQGLIGLAWDASASRLCATYYDSHFPLDPATYPLVLDLPLDAPQAADYSQLMIELRALPDRNQTDSAVRETRGEQCGRLKTRLGELLRQSDAAARHCERCIAAFTAPGNASRLHALLERQAWRLAFWRTAADEVNYRRFFDINELAGLRQEEPEVFTATHRLIGEWVAKGQVNALRIDHGDGLRDPQAYYARLAEYMVQPLYVITEKILGQGETLPSSWAVHGSTGYDWLGWSTALFTYGPAELEFEKLLRRITSRRMDVDEELYRAKRLVMRTLLGSELTALAARVNRWSEADPHTRDYTLNALRDALAEVAANFPFYRSYVTDRGASLADRAMVDHAIAIAKSRSGAEDVSIFDFLRQVLLLEHSEGAARTRRPEAVRPEAAAIAARFQQFTAPLMAKGLEDTVFYRYHRLEALNDVGSDPRRFSVSLDEFHAENERRAVHWPHSMLASSTHDTKRSEDARLRLCVLSQFASEWRQLVFRCLRMNRSRRGLRDAQSRTDRGTEYLLYQSLLAIWPLSSESSPDEPTLAALRERIQAYMGKAIREAKQHTSWVNPNPEYEQGLANLVAALIPDGGNDFTRMMSAFVQRLAGPAMLAGLSHQLLKLTCPGVPDIYQGTELIDLSLVDPDNRRPVDFELRQRTLQQLEAMTPSPHSCTQLLADLSCGTAKLFLTSRALRLRRLLPALFEHGAYIPLQVRGAQAQHVLAFARRQGEHWAIVIISRWHASLAPAGWDADTHVLLPDSVIESASALVDHFTDSQIAIASEGDRPLHIARALAHFPCALLTAA